MGGRLFIRRLIFALTFLALLCMLAPEQWFSTQAKQLCSVLCVFAVGFLAALLGGFFPGIDLTRLQSSRSALFSIACISLLGAALRFWHLDFGFPSFNHPDEGIKEHVIRGMLDRGSLNPRYFLHPSLLLYLGMAVSRLYSAIGLRPDEAQNIILGGRTVSAIFGTLSIYLVFLIGRRIISNRSALIAATLVAVSPLHVTCSRYMKEDVLCLSFVLFVILFVVCWVQTAKPKYLWLAALFSGIAAGSKYTGGLSAIIVAAGPFLMAYSRTQTFVPKPKQLLTAAGALIICAPLGFFITTPYAVLDYDKFFANFMVERNHMLAGHHGVEISAWSQYWMYHFARSLVPGMGVFAAILGVLGLGASIRGPRPWGLFLVALFLLFYLPAEWVKAKPPPQAERYVLGCVPFLALAAAYSFEFLSRLYRGLALSLLLAATILVPSIRTVQLGSDLQTDTRALMTKWIAENIPADRSILIEASYSPHLNNLPNVRKFMKARKHPSEFMVDSLKESGYDYLLVTSFSYERHFNEPRFDPLMRKRFGNIFKRFRLVKEVAAPHGSYGFHNPTLRVYALKNDLVP